jgi:hypothetical protein
MRNVVRDSCTDFSIWQKITLASHKTGYRGNGLGFGETKGVQNFKLHTQCIMQIRISEADTRERAKSDSAEYSISSF